MVPTLFWSFAADTSLPEEAMQGFITISMGAQIGGIAGPLFVLFYLKTGDPVVLTGLCACGIAAVFALVWYFMHTMPQSDLEGYHRKEGLEKDAQQTAPSFIEGIVLIAQSSYLRALACLVLAYEVITTLMEFHVKLFVSQSHQGVHDFAKFFLHYSLMMNSIAFVCLLLGSGRLAHWCGVRRSLLVFVVLMGALVLVVGGMPTLTVALGALLISKGLNYAFNQPVKEQLYIPTTPDTRYKAKAWIDTFGLRIFKALGGGVYLLRPLFSDMSLFFLYTTGVSVVLLFLWGWAALHVGRRHDDAISQNKLVN